MSLAEFVEELKYEVGSITSMAPEPWEDSRDRIECANGNEMHTRADIVAYCNWTFKRIPEAAATIDQLAFDNKKLCETLKVWMTRGDELRRKLNRAKMALEIVDIEDRPSVIRATAKRILKELGDD